MAARPIDAPRPAEQTAVAQSPFAGERPVSALRAGDPRRSAWAERYQDQPDHFTSLVDREAPDGGANPFAKKSE